MGVGIDEAGDQGAAAAVEPLGVRQLAELAAALLGRAGEGDAPVPADHFGARDPADSPLVRPPAGRRAFGGRDLGEAVNQQVNHGAGL